MPGSQWKTPVPVFIYSYWVDIQLLFNLRMCPLLYVLDQVSAKSPSYGVQPMLPLLSSVVRFRAVDRQVVAHVRDCQMHRRIRSRAWIESTRRSTR